MCPSIVKRPKAKSADQALNSLMNLCARSERCSGDALRLMERWQVEPAERPRVLARLTELRFIDDRRFTELYIREKCNLNGWGSRRIAMELARRGVDREIVDEQLSQLDGAQLEQRLYELLVRRLRTTKGKSSYEIKGKLLRYGATLGYDYSMMSRALERLDINNESECDDFFF